MINQKKELILEFSLKGFDKKDVKVELKDNFVTIEASRHSEKKEEKKNESYAEASQQQVKYKESIPAIYSKKAKIEFKDGRLMIRAPKRHASEEDSNEEKLVFDDADVEIEAGGIDEPDEQEDDL